MSATEYLAPLSLFEGESCWPEEFGSDRPQSWETSRNPTVRELRQVIASLKGYEVLGDLDHGNPLWIGSPTEGVNVFVEEYLPERDQDKPLKVHFDGTDTLEVRIVEKLAHLCGPLLLAGEMFIIVEAGTAADTPWQLWPRRF